MAPPIHGDCSAGVIAIPYPPARSSRYAAPWLFGRPYHLQGPSIVRVAHHEAGHVVYMEWLGLDGLTAEARPESGSALFKLPAASRDTPTPQDVGGLLSAEAAALYQAGWAAELLWSRTPATGPLHQPDAVDYKMADQMLRPAFGFHSSAGHWYSLRIALHVLSHKWQRVQFVAETLERTGRWNAAVAGRAYELQHA